MRSIIALITLSVISLTLQAQLAEFDVIGFEDSRFTLTKVSVKDGKVVSRLISFDDDEDGNPLYMLYAERIVVTLHEPGAYVITQRHNNKEVHLTIIVPEEGLQTKKSYRLRRRNVYIG